VTVYVSDLLTATPAPVNASPSSTRTWQWLQDGAADISGATSITYRVQETDVGRQLSVRQIEANFLGTATAVSALTAAVQAFSPAALFRASEPGVWYDPADVANLDWRVNLLLWTQEFNNAVWSTGGTASVAANTTVAPDGTSTADTLTATAGFFPHQIVNAVGMGVSILANTTYATSIYVKAGTSSFFQLYLASAPFGSNAFANFNLITGAISAVGSAATASIQAVGDGWYRCTVAATATAAATGASARVNFAIVTSATAPRAEAWTGTGTETLFIWGAQLEVGSTATTYQPITTVDAGTIARFPSATLYQDSAGTTPVTTPGQPVGLMLDKSQGLALGPELVTNGDFSNGSTGWLLTSSAVVNGALNCSSATSLNFAVGNISLVAGLTYQVAFTISNYTSGSIFLQFGVGANVSTPGFSGDGVWTAKLVAGVGNVELRMQCPGGGFVGTIDNITVKLLSGNHATQSNAAQRPTYGVVPATGRRNLLTWTEQFDNAVWVKTAGVSASGTSVSYAGGLGGTREVTQLALIPGGTANKTITVFVTVSGSGSFRLKNTHSGVLDNFSSNFTATSTPQTFSFTVTNGAGAGNGFQTLGISNTSGDAAFSLTVQQVQLETGSTATAYQRVTTGFDVTEAGVASMSYVSFDGTDDGMLTGNIVPGIDKAQVFAGVRKLSDVTQGIIVESSADFNANAGTFVSATGTNGAPGPNYHSSSRGNAPAAANQAANSAALFAAPITNVVTATHDIPADLSAMRVNGAASGTNGTGEQGTGNFLTYPLYIGRRGGSSLPFNGQIFSLIVRFGTNLPAATITQAETWVGARVAPTINIPLILSPTILDRFNDTVLDRAGQTIEVR